MDQLTEFVGAEHGLDVGARALKDYAQRTGAPVVGALHLTCSDESERECVEAFQRCFVEPLLPGLTPWNKSAFRTSTLGGRYEWGSLPIAELHFATVLTQASFKCMVVKINAHVSVTQTAQGPAYGPMARYGVASTACGALHAMLEGVRIPFADDLREMFVSEGMDRLAMLRDPECVDPAYRHLFASVANARLQARRVVLEIQDRAPTSPTVYVVVPSVTLNRPGYDTEFVCGVYAADVRTDQGVIEYCGLGDDPSRYVMRCEGDHIRVADDGIGARRVARDHRRLVRDVWSGGEWTPPPPDERITKLKQDVEQSKHHNHPYAAAMAETLLRVMSDVSPIPAAVALFAEGAMGLCHAHKMHRIARDATAEGEARQLLGDVKGRLKELPPERTRTVIEWLLALHLG